MRISNKGIAIIKKYEGCKLKAYQDVRGIWTIGYGHTKDVYPGMAISQYDAEQLLLEDIWYTEEGVNDLVTVPINQNQFDALTSFAFNCGLDIDDDLKAEGLGDSTLLKKLNRADYIGAADEFLKWNKSGGKVYKGLINRRAEERNLFLSQDNG